MFTGRVRQFPPGHRGAAGRALAGAVAALGGLEGPGGEGGRGRHPGGARPAPTRLRHLPAGEEARLDVFQ